MVEHPPSFHDHSIYLLINEGFVSHRIHSRPYQFHLSTAELPIYADGVPHLLHLCGVTIFQSMPYHASTHEPVFRQSRMCTGSSRCPSFHLFLIGHPPFTRFRFGGLGLGSGISVTSSSTRSLADTFSILLLLGGAIGLATPTMSNNPAILSCSWSLRVSVCFHLLTVSSSTALSILWKLA